MGFYTILYQFSYNYPQKAQKLLVNDSLSLLYLFSSNIYTLWILSFLLFTIHLFGQKNSSTLLCLLISISFYFLYKHQLIYVTTFVKTSSINTTLTNGLLNIHPYLMYYSYIVLILFFYVFYRKDTVRSIFTTTTTYIYFLTITAGLGMYLGALWATQELNWGGFWSWDPVELISLLITIYFLSKLHNKHTWVFNKSVVVFVSFVYLVYIIIRLGILNTIHSFIKSNNIPLYILYIIKGWLIYQLYTYTKYVHSLYKSQGLRFSQQLTRVVPTYLNVYIYSYILSLIYNATMFTPTLVIDHIQTTIFYFILSLVAMVMSHNHKYNTIIVLSGIIVFITLTFWSKSFLCISVLIFCFIYKLKLYLRFTHLIICATYIIYVLFFISTTQYNTLSTLLLTWYNTTNISLSGGASMFYENTLIFKKHIFLVNLKNIFSHITGFFIKSNLFVSDYFFSKNNNIYCLFSIELVMCTSLLILLYSLLYFNTPSSIYTTKTSQHY